MSPGRAPEAGVARKGWGVGGRIQPPVHEVIAQLCRRNPRYATQAYLFVLEALQRQMVELDSPRHITGAELASSVCNLALDRFGLLARTVLEHWGINATSDLGEIVFLLIDHGVLTKQDTDSREDFEELFSFERVFEADYPWGH
ncbi:MAG: hypothetical protein E4H28_01400 [Gemmatimonadales bacterium]|nr:MAG: hypothetical protein E4H28_01400 [Gemmatimonadales bacterium]